MYFNGYISRDCCSTCKFTKLDRISDITLGDYWGVEKSHPHFNDEKGINLILINSKKGQKIFEEIKKDIDYRLSNDSDCLQPQLMYPSKDNKKTNVFWDDYFSKGFEYVAKKYTSLGFKNSVIEKILNIKVLTKKIIKTFINKHFK